MPSGTYYLLGKTQVKETGTPSFQDQKINKQATAHLLTQNCIPEENCIQIQR